VHRTSAGQGRSEQHAIDMLQLPMDCGERVLVVDAGESRAPDEALRAGMFGTRHALSISKAGLPAAVASLWIAPASDWVWALHRWRRFLGSHEWAIGQVPVGFRGVLGPGRSHQARLCVARYLIPRMIDSWIARYGPPRIAQVHWGLQATSQAAMAYLYQIGIPYLLTEHSSRFLQPATITAAARAQYARLAHQAALVTAVGAPLAESMADSLGLHGVEVTPNAIDPMFSHDPTPTQERGLRLVTVGTSPVKRVDLLLEALGAANLHGAQCELTIVGPCQQFEPMLRRLPARIRVRSILRVSPSRLAELFREADSYVCGSQHETFGMAPIEAAATGAVLVSTECGPPADAARSGLGLVAATGVEGLRGALEALASDIDRWRASREHRASLASARFGLRPVGERLVQLVLRAEHCAAKTPRS
jgi:glycosyltransferase involved in cell wall biosynthesis